MYLVCYDRLMVEQVFLVGCPNFLDLSDVNLHFAGGLGNNCCDNNYCGNDDYRHSDGNKPPFYDTCNSYGNIQVDRGDTKPGNSHNNKEKHKPHILVRILFPT